MHDLHANVKMHLKVGNDRRKKDSKGPMVWIEHENTWTATVAICFTEKKHAGTHRQDFWGIDVGECYSRVLIKELGIFGIL